MLNSNTYPFEDKRYKIYIRKQNIGLNTWAYRMM